MKRHIPVMTDEVIKYLAPQKNKNYVDCTVGLGGHSRKIIEKIRPYGKLLCIDFNKESLDEARENLKNYHEQSIFICSNFRNLQEVVWDINFKGIFGILYDLGLASWQIEDSGIGISFLHNEPLDMRLSEISNFQFPCLAARRAFSNKIPNPKFQNPNAEYIINKFSVKKLADIFYQYGDARNSWSIARKIEIARRKKPIRTTFDLRNALNSKNPKFLAPIFQAFRIVVNNEFKNLEDSLQQAIKIIDSGGRIVVISYHSGEDRITKNIFRTNKNKLRILTKKPITPSQIEIRTNSRARSAKLRVVEKI